MSKNKTPKTAELSSDIQKLFDNYIVKKICANTEKQLGTISETSNALKTSQEKIFKCTSNLLDEAYDTKMQIQGLGSTLPEELGKIPSQTDKLVTGKLKTINNNVVEKTGKIIQLFEDNESNWKKRHDSLIEQIDIALQNNNNELSKKMEALSEAEYRISQGQCENLLERLNGSTAAITKLCSDSQAALEKNYRQNTEKLFQAIHAGSLQATENENANLSTLQTNIETSTHNITESVQKIGSEIQAAQTDSYKRIVEVINDVSHVANKNALQHEENFQRVIRQLKEMEIANIQRTDKIVTSWQKESAHLKNLLYISWVICGIALAATILSILM